MEKIKERDLTWQIEEFMICCKSKDLRRKTMQSYEQTLRLFERWCNIINYTNLKFIVF